MLMRGDDNDHEGDKDRNGNQIGVIIRCGPFGVTHFLKDKV